MDDVPPTILRYIAAYNGIDVAAMLGCLSDDVHFVNKSGGVVTAETYGRDAFRDLAGQGAAAFSVRRQTVVNCIAAGDRATLRIDYRAVVATDLPNGWKAGQVIELNGVSFFRLDSGRIAEIIDTS